jgi:AP-1 complex subunit mu
MFLIKLSFFFKTLENFYFIGKVVAITKRNTNAVLVISLLYKIIDAFIAYFKELEEESIRDNFVMIYELLDEFIDFGFPQTTDTKILKEYILGESNQLNTEKAKSLLSTVTGAVSWRPDNIIYPINEVFLDVVESVNILVNSSGVVIKSEVVGSVKMRVYLSGMPELRLGLNDRAILESNST